MTDEERVIKFWAASLLNGSHPRIVLNSIKRYVKQFG